MTIAIVDHAINMTETDDEREHGDHGDAQPDLKVVRRQWKAAVTRHLNTLQRHIAEGDVEQVRDRLNKVKVTFSELESAHEAFQQTLTTDAEFDQSESWFPDAQRSYISSIKSAKQWLGDDDKPVSVKSKVTTVTGATQSSSAQSHETELINLLSIPKLEIDKFHGNPLEFQSFMAIFDEAVSSKVSDDQIKLTRLLQYTTGPAKAAIRNCALIGGRAGYTQARDILQKRFGNEHLVSRKILNDLINGKSVSKPNDIRQLADDLAMAAAVLKSLNLSHEIDNQNSVLEILQRVPKAIQSKWRNKALEVKRDSGSYPTFDYFVEFMSKIASDWSDPVYGGDALKSFSNNSPRAKTSSVNTFSADSSAPLPQKPQTFKPCVSCGQSHRLIYCPVFKTMRPTARLQLAREKRLCYNCLMPNHVVALCRNKSVCSVPDCGKRHSKFLHTDIITGNGNTSESVATGGAAGGSTDNTVNCGSTCAFGTSVYLPIVQLSVNGEHVHALLDTGSTNTFFSERLAQSLSLSGYSHDYVIKTVSRIKPTSSQVVKINVSSLDGSYSQELSNVLVVPSIPAKYPADEIDVN